MTTDSQCGSDIPTEPLPGRLTGQLPIIKETAEAWIIKRVPGEVMPAELAQATEASVIREWNLYVINGPGKGIKRAPYFY